MVEDLFGKETIWVPYRRPGFRLSKEVWAAIRARPDARAIVLEKHGLSTWGPTLKDAYLATIELVTRAEGRLQDAARGRRVFGAPSVPPPDAETPAARGPRGRAGPAGHARTRPTRRAPVRRRPGRPRSRGAPEAARLTQVGPSTPDHTIYSKRLPCFVPLADPASPAAVVEAARAAVDRFVQEYTAYFEAHRHGELMQPARPGLRRSPRRG